MVQVPLCAFAILLVYTGFKLASPAVFKQVFGHGIEQLIFFVGTMVLTLYTNLLVGLFGGLLLALVSQLLLAKVSIPRFFNLIFRGGSNLVVKPDGSYDLKVRGISNFLSILSLDKLLEQIPSGAKVTVDLSETRLVGFTVMEHLHDFQKLHENTGGEVEIRGHESHSSTNNHKLALKFKTDTTEPLNPRQKMLKEMAESYGWNFQVEPLEAFDYFQSFHFFKTRPIDAESNCISDLNKDVHLELIDVTFEEGADIFPDEYETTVGLIKMPCSIPKFTIEKKGFLDRYLHLSEHKDIDDVVYNDFLDDFVVRVEDKNAMDEFLTEEFKALIEISRLNHIESNGEALLIFNNNFRLAQLLDYVRMIQFADNLKKIIKE